MKVYTTWHREGHSLAGIDGMEVATFVNSRIRRSHALLVRPKPGNALQPQLIPLPALVRYGLPVELSHVFVVPSRRKEGHGTAMVRRLMNIADEHAWLTVLRTLPYQREGTGMDTDRLVLWYERFGFEKYFSGADTIGTYSLMIRYPKPHP